MGHNVDQLGPRFPDMTEAYDLEHRKSLLALAEQKGIDIHQGVYISVTGPSYETPAEIRAFRTLGADAVGMSTVNEVITANHCGLRVLGLSCISNAAAGMGDEKLDHGDVKDVVNAMGLKFEDLVESWIGTL
jgi:purine-nucleoside phosphorylase